MTNCVPDCTIVTACYNLSNYHSKTRTLQETLDQIDIIMKIPAYMIIYTDNMMAEGIQQLRSKYGLSHLTTYRIIEFDQLWCYKYIEQIRKNRERKWDTRDERTCAESHALTCNKMSFVLQAIETNPFETSKFLWLDAFVGQNGNMKICENYSLDKIMYVLQNITDKFHIQILAVCDKKYIDKKYIDEYYRQYRWIVCGGLFSCGKEIGKKILTRLQEVFIQTTELGYGHGEEMLYLEILDEFYDDIYRSYGDYGQMVNNFIKPTRNFHHIYHMILNRYLQYGYHRECYDCAKTLVQEIESYTVHVGWDYYMNVLFNYYVSAFYYRPNESLQIANHIYSLCEINPYMNAEFNKQVKSFHGELKYANMFKEQCTILFCVFACATHPKYKAEICKIEETWGKRAKAKGIKVLYFLGEEQTDLLDPEKYIYLKGVKNDYMSASDKQNLGLKYIYERYDPKFVFVCGTDTYVNIDKLELLVQTYNCHQPLYIGGHGANVWINNKEYYFHSGGSGYILSKESLHLVYLQLKNMFSEWKKICNAYINNDAIPACDVAISYYLQNTIGSALKIDTLDCFNSCNHKGYCENGSKCCGDKIVFSNIVACHRMQMHDFDEFTKILEDNHYFV